MDHLHRTYSAQLIGPVRKAVIFLSYAMLCLYGILFFLESLLGFNPRIIPLLRFGSALVAFLAVLLDGKIFLRPNRFFLWYLGIIAMSFVSNLYTVGNNGMAVSINMLETAFVAIAFYSTLRNRECIKQFLFLLGCSGGVLFLVLLANNALHVDNRLGTALTEGNTNNFAEYVMITFIAATITLTVTKRKSVKLIALVMCAVEIYMLLLSGGRKYIVAPLLMIVLFVWQKMKTVSLLKKLCMLFGVVIGLILLWNLIMTNEVLYNALGKRFEEDSVESGTGDRFALVARGLSFFVRRPFFGYGENAYTSLNGAAFGDYRYSHNTYVELLTNLGLVGFLLYYIPYLETIIALRKASKKSEKDNLAILFFAFMISTLFLHIGTVAYATATLLIQLVAIGFRLVEFERQEINLIAEEKTDNAGSFRNTDTCTIFLA